MRGVPPIQARLMQWLSGLFIPGGVIVSAAGLFAWRPTLLPDPVLPLLRGLPIVIFGTGLLLAWFFHRSRITFAVLLISVTYAALWHVTDGPTAQTTGRQLVPALGVLLPINLVVLLILQERGIFTPKGLWMLGAIFLQAMAILVVNDLGSGAAVERAAYTWIDAKWTAWMAVPHAAQFIFGTAAGFVLIRFGLNGRSIETGFFWTLVALFLALHTSHLRDSLLYFSAAGLVLVVSLIQTSYAMAYHDDLTGLAGRRALNETLLRLGPPYVIAMIDVDHFKSFNDRYGHDVGDQVLRMVASKIELISGGGRAFRYGGEEFAVVFQGMGVTEAAPHLEALRRTIEASRFAIRNRSRPRKKPNMSRLRGYPRQEVSVTVSMGAAEPSDRLRDPSDVLTAADRALYRAKRAGRNQLKY